MNIILHITTKDQWAEAQSHPVHRGDTLGTEGFIHCSTPQQVVAAANTYFPGKDGLVLLVIDPERVQAEIRFEATGGTEAHPHIYGPLNLAAVVQVLPFPPGPDGKFSLPTLNLGS